MNLLGSFHYPSHNLSTKFIYPLILFPSTDSSNPHNMHFWDIFKPIVKKLI